jgi:hypothetical protein
MWLYHGVHVSANLDKAQPGHYGSQIVPYKVNILHNASTREDANTMRIRKGQQEILQQYSSLAAQAALWQQHAL